MVFATQSTVTSPEGNKAPPEFLKVNLTGIKQSAGEIVYVGQGIVIVF